MRSEGVEVGATEVAGDFAAVALGEGGEGAGLGEVDPVLEGTGVPSEWCTEECGVATAVQCVGYVCDEEVGVNAGSCAFSAVAAEGFEHNAVNFCGGRWDAVQAAVVNLVLAEGF